MLQLSDLRLGNFIYCQGVNTPLSADLFTRLSNDADAFELLQPVILTREWMMDFGFTVTETPEHSIFEKNGFELFMLETPLLKNKAIFLYIRGAGEVKYTKFQYVHQLQNLYFEVKREEV